MHKSDLNNQLLGIRKLKNKTTNVIRKANKVHDHFVNNCI